MRAVAIVGVEPGAHGLGAFGRACEGLPVGPFAQARLNEALRLAIGAGRVGSGALVLEPGGNDRLAEVAAAVGGAVVGHHALDGDAEAGKPSQGPLEERHRALFALVGEDFRVGQAGGIVDADVEEIPADAAAAAGSITGDAVSNAVDLAELLDVKVDQLAGAVALVADRLESEVERGESAEAAPAQDEADGRDGPAELTKRSRTTPNY